MAFSITLQSMDTVTAKLSGESFASEIALTLDCLQPSHCVNLGDNSRTVSYTNGSGGPQTIFLLVDGTFSGSGTYDLAVTIDEFVPG